MVAERNGLVDGFAHARKGEALGLAAYMFLVILAAGAVLLVAGKLQFPSLGAGASPFEVIKAAGLLGLACLGVPVDLGGLELSVVPLGMLGVIAVACTAMARTFLKGPSSSAATEAFIVAVSFAAMTGVAALVFGFGGDTKVEASALLGGIAGLVWGLCFVGLGWFAATGVRLPWNLDYRLVTGWGVGRTFAGLAAIGSFIATLCLILGRLILDPLPPDFSLGDVAAAALYLIAFLPNVLVAVFSLAVGATLDIGAQVDVGGELVGPLRSLAILGGGGHGALKALLVLPLFVGVAGGYLAPKSRGPFSMLALRVSIGSFGFASAVGMLAWAGDARLGAGLVRGEGVGVVAVHPLQAGLLTFAWSFFGALAGAWLAERMEGRNG